MRKASGKVILNAAPARSLSPALAALIDVIVVSAIEAEQLAEVPVVDTLDGVLEAARILARSYLVAVVTAGGDGVACATAEGEEFRIEAIKVKLISTHGAGDEFGGVLAAELAKRIDLGAALHAANRAAALLVSTPLQI
jgi:ribokinase